MAEYYDYLMRTIPYGEWCDYVESLMDRHGLTAGLVLDLCCGTGRVGSEMLRRGYDCVGVDLAAGMVRRCGAQSPPLLAAVMDARTLGLRAETFDVAVSLYDSLNYILEPEGLASCFRGVARALRPAGGFVFDMNTVYALSAGLFAQNNVGSGDALEYDWRPTWDAASRICRVDMDFRWRGAAGERTFTEVHYQRAYETPELTAMLAGAGFATVDVYHAYTYRKPNRWSDRIYVVARKATP